MQTLICWSKTAYGVVSLHYHKDRRLRTTHMLRNMTKAKRNHVSRISMPTVSTWPLRASRYRSAISESWAMWRCVISISTASRQMQRSGTSWNAIWSIRPISTICTTITRWLRNISRWQETCSAHLPWVCSTRTDRGNPRRSLCPISVPLMVECWNGLY